MQTVAMFSWALAGPLILVLAVFTWIATTRLNPQSLRLPSARAYRAVQILVLLTATVAAFASYGLLLWNYDIKGH
jgi:hypothetical protein